MNEVKSDAISRAKSKQAEDERCGESVSSNT